MMNQRLRRSRRTLLHLEAMDARDVPATLVDLTSAGAQGTANGAVFEQHSGIPAGFNAVHPFLRVRANGVEQGYNTDFRPLQFDENDDHQSTRSLKLSQVPIVTVNGVNYREFVLNINQKHNHPLLSLDELRIYLGSTGNQHGYNAGSHTLAGLAPLYDMDGAGDVTVKLNASLSVGSGWGDAIVLVPNSLFSASTGSVYLYSKFGGSWNANGGYEAWAVPVGGTTTPPPAPASLSGTVFQDSNGNHVIDTGDLGFGGITVNMMDSLGNVVGSTITAADGSYSFTNLAAGSYTVEMVVPDPTYLTMLPQVGSTQSGTPDGTAEQSWVGITTIQLNAGDVGTGYNLGMYQGGSLN